MNVVKKIKINNKYNMEKKTWTKLFEEIPWYEEKNDKDEYYTIEDLLAFDGHSVSKSGEFKLENWSNLITKIKNNINYNEIKFIKYWM